MNWLRLVIWTLAPLVGAALVSKGARALKSAKTAGSGRAGRALASGDLDKMVAATRIPAPPLKRHQLLSAIVARTYPDRQDPKTRELFYRFARIHVAEYDSLHRGGEPLQPPMQSHKRLAIALEEDERFQEGIAVSRRALDIGLEDGTKTGFAGRIARLEKKSKRKSER